MNPSKLVVPALSVLLLNGILCAQPIFYHESEDKKAQSVDAAAKQITNGAIFDKEIQNLDALSKIQIQRVLSFAQVQFKNGIASFITWKDVSDQLNTVEQSLQPTIETLTDKDASDQVEEVKKRIAEVKASIAKLQDPADTPDVIQEISSNLATADEVLNFADKLPKNAQFSVAIENVKNSLDTAKSLYDSFAAIFAARKDAEGKLPSTEAAKKAAELRLLNLEVQHLQWIAQNSSRESAESASVLSMVTAARTKLSSQHLSASDEPIGTTLERLAHTAASDADATSRTAARQSLFLLLIALHEAAAARSEAGLPRQLGDLRETQEEYRYSILTSAEQVKATEALIQGAASRLALYYKGGIKPAQLAQLLYNLSGLVSLPVIASK